MLRGKRMFPNYSFLVSQYFACINQYLTIIVYRVYQYLSKRNFLGVEKFLFRNRHLLIFQLAITSREISKKGKSQKDITSKTHLHIGFYILLGDINFLNTSSWNYKNNWWINIPPYTIPNCPEPSTSSGKIW